MSFEMTIGEGGGASRRKAELTRIKNYGAGGKIRLWEGKKTTYPPKGGGLLTDRGGSPQPPCKTSPSALSEKGDRRDPEGEKTACPMRLLEEERGGKGGWEWGGVVDRKRGKEVPKKGIHQRRVCALEKKPKKIF